VYDDEAGVRLTSWALCAATLEEHVKLAFHTLLILHDYLRSLETGLFALLLETLLIQFSRSSVEAYFHICRPERLVGCLLFALIIQFAQNPSVLYEKNASATPVQRHTILYYNIILSGRC
jgi:hypothetical protein